MANKLKNEIKLFYMKVRRAFGGVSCPYCDTKKSYEYPEHFKYKCRYCNRIFEWFE